MKKLLAILLLGFSSVYAQTVTAETTTPNLITSGTNHTWTGVTTGTLPSNYMPGGPTPLYDPAANSITFSYGSPRTVAQTIAINNALSSVGAGVKINGYNYSYDARNMNGDNRQNGVDSFTVNTKMTSNTGSTLLSSTENYNTKFEWTSFSGSRTANTPYELNAVGNLQFSVTGADNGYWGGYFGPQVRNVNMNLRYTVDPCATNPAYSTNCANYGSVSTSGNLVPNPAGYAVYGSMIDQTYAINQALAQSGSNVMIHGFQWGYVANANGPYCGSWDMGLLGCWDWRTPSVSTNVNITSNTGASLYNVSRTYQNSYNTTNYSYLFPSSKNLTTLGSFGFTASTNDAAYVGQMWSKALYTPDPCTVDPLSSASCPGYQQALLNQQCPANPLYSSACPGYAQALFTQQCNANQMSNPSCPGYAAAYLTYQCSINPLYSTTCSGYQQAYHDQQCSISPLYASDCTGYSRAYHDQQCSISPLYASDCTGYTQAYLNQQCSINPLYSTQCNGYAAAYKSQQCSANPLYATDCPGYTQAYFSQQCTLNGLYDRACPNYGDAYAKANILNITSTTSTVTSTAPAPVATTTSTTTAMTSDPVAALAPVIADPVVNNVVTTAKPSAASTETSPAAAVKLVAPAPAPAAAVAQADTKKDDKKDETKSNGNSNTSNSPSADSKPSDQPKSNREALAERRREDAKKEAVAKGKDLANEMGKASDMEAQKAIQNVVIQAMGFTPGFDTYNKAMLPDAQFYRPYQVYGGQVNVDNRNISRRLMSGSDAKHQEMIDSQYREK
jgi:hypothetical protein